MYVKSELAQASYHAPPVSDAKLSLTVDASNSVIGAILQPSIKGRNESLAFYSYQPKAAKLRYSMFRKKHLAIYLVVRLFSHLLGSRDFTTFTGHKLLTFALLPKQPATRPEKRGTCTIYHSSPLTFVTPLTMTAHLCRRFISLSC